MQKKVKKKKKLRVRVVVAESVREKVKYRGEACRKVVRL